MKKRALVFGLCAVLSCFVFVGSAMAAYYTCLIDRIIPTSNGQIRLQLLPGTGETKFTGTIRVFIDPTKPGAKNMYAAALTALSLGSDVSISCATVPTWDPVIETSVMGVVAP
jgi:hypothetical protein